MMECWIPGEEELRPGEDWRDYELRLYDLFKADFLDSRPMFDGMPVRVRVNPKYDEREEAFWHLTCRDYSHGDGLPESRDPDMERCRRIRWPRAFIENHRVCALHSDMAGECRGVMVWTASHTVRRGRSVPRVKLFQEDESYLVVLEPRRKKGYCLLITAYHVEEEWSRRKIMREAEKNEALFVGPCG